MPLNIFLVEILTFTATQLYLQASRQPQVIQAGAGIRGLGISLRWLLIGGGDGGRLVIGAHESDAVMTVRTQPVIRLLPGKTERFACQARN